MNAWRTLRTALMTLTSLVTFGCKRDAAAKGQAGDPRPGERPPAEAGSGDVHLDLTVDRKAVSLGEVVEVNFRGDILKIRIPRDIVPGTTLRARGLGNPDTKGGQGALYIHVHIGAELIGCKRSAATPAP